MVVLMAYDEDEYLRRVSSMARRDRVAWAAAAAELLLPTASRLPRIVPKSAVESMRVELDRAWLATDSGTVAPATPLPSPAEGFVPDEDQDGWTFEHGLLANVAASVAYATSCANTGDAQEAIWAWRQVHEVVDIVLNDRIDRGNMDRSGLPDVDRIIRLYLSTLEEESAERLRAAVRTRADPLSKALVPD